MSFRTTGTIGPTVIVSRDPDRSGNYVCDGTADDVEIQAAVNYVNARGGGQIKLKQGTYVLSSTVTINPQIEIIGDGKEVTIVDGANGINPFSVNPGGGAGEGGSIENLSIELLGDVTGITIDNVYRFRVHHVRIYAELPGTGYGTGISVVNAALFTNVRECRFINYNTRGISFTGGNGSLVEICYFEGRDGSVDIYVEGIQAPRIEKNWFEYNSPNGGTHIEFNNVNRGTISSNNIGPMFTAGSYGIHLHTNTRECVIDENNFVSAGGIMVYIPASAEEFNIISNNTFHFDGVNAIYCLQRDTIIDDNTIWVGSSVTGRVIQILGADNCIISNNDIWAASLVAQRAINLTGTINRALILGNTIKHLQNGIYLDTNISNASVFRNRFNSVTTPLTDLGTDNATPEITTGSLDPLTTMGDHPVVTMADGVTTNVYDRAILPLEFQQLISAQVIVCQTTTAGPPNMRWQIDTDFGKICANENYNAHSDAIGATDTAVDQNQMECLNILAALTDVAAGDLIGFNFARIGGHANDTVNAAVYYMGIRLRYV